MLHGRRRLWYQVRIGRRIGGGDRKAAGSGNQLVFSPARRPIVETLPKGRKLSLNLEYSCQHDNDYCSSGKKYLQLPHNRLAEIFCSRVGAQCDQITSIDVLLAHTALTFLGSRNPLSFKSSRLAFLLSLATFKRNILSFAGGASANTKDLCPTHASS